METRLRLGKLDLNGFLLFTVRSRIDKAEIIHKGKVTEPGRFPAFDERETMKTFIGTKIINAERQDRPDESPSQIEGYRVVYADGYESWSPKDTFEAAYRETSGLTFGLALEVLKKGAKVARAGWNGKGMFVYYVPPASYLVQADAAKSHFGEAAMVPHNAYFAIKNVDETVSTWVPSVNDCLAEDWVVIV